MTWPFHKLVSSWHWPSYDLEIQRSSLKVCVKVFFVSYIFTPYPHTLLLLSRFWHWYATLWTSNCKETFICVEQVGKKYKNPALMRDPHFPLVFYYKDANEHGCTFNAFCVDIVPLIHTRWYNWGHFTNVNRSNNWLKVSKFLYVHADPVSS